jgi:hypothetical protein
MFPFLKSARIPLKNKLILFIHLGQQLLNQNHNSSNKLYKIAFNECKPFNNWIQPLSTFSDTV